MSAPDPQVSFIIPLFNEEDVFEKLINRLNDFTTKLDITFEILLIDDGSHDQTVLKARLIALTNKNYHCVFLSRNFGHQLAVSAGLKYARGTEAVMILDGDLQDPPELFTEFYKQFKDGYDVVYGIRKKRKENVIKKSSYFLFYRLLASIAGTPVSVDSGDFSLLSRKVVNIMNIMPEDSRFLRGMRSWIGFRQTGVEYERDFRAAGIPKYTYRKLARLAYDGIFNFSSFPIKFLTLAGGVCITISFLYLIITILRKFIYHDVPVGFTALLFMIVFFGGIQLLSMGIIGEYVFRTFQQVKNRPLFIVKERVIEGEILYE